MPLRDHFHLPASRIRSWDEVHGQWPAEMVRHLSAILPKGFIAGPKLHLGSPHEIDVSAQELDSLNVNGVDEIGGGGGVATASVAAPTLVVQASFLDQDEFEIRIYDAERGRTLVAAIEIISPSNKDRPKNRELFVGKVVTLLQQGVCVSIVDAVTSHESNLYSAFLEALDRTDPKNDSPSHIYSVSLRLRKEIVRRKQVTLVDVWYYPMTIGQALPMLPIWLSADLHISLPLETSYEETCRVLGIPAP